VGCCGWLTVDSHTKVYFARWLGRAHHQVKVARVKAIADPSARALEHDGLATGRPLTGQRPLIESQRAGVGAQPLARPLRKLQNAGFDFDVAVGGFRVGAGPMTFLDQRAGRVGIYTGQSDVVTRPEREAAFLREQ